MPRNKSPFVSPHPATSIPRRSARLISLRGQEKPEKAPGFGSEPPPPRRKPRRELRPEAKKSPDSLRRSLRVSKRGVSDDAAAGNEKSPTCSSTKPASTPSSCSFTLRRSPRFSSGGGGSGNSVVLSSCTSTSTKSVPGGDGFRSSRSRPRSKTKQISIDCNDEEDVSVRLSEEKGNGVRSKDRSKSRPCSNSKQICIDCDCNCDDDDDDADEEFSLCLGEVKRMKLANENDAPKADGGKRIIDKEEGLKTKSERGGWTEELELALQGAYLTVKPSPNFWKKVSKLVPGKSAQECFDRVNADLITPRQTQPRSRAKKSNLSPIPRFSLSASKLLKPISPAKTKMRQRKGNLSKKAIRHLLEKQNHMDQGLGFDLFSVLEPGAAGSSFLSTPTEKGKSLPRIIESPAVLPGSSKDQANLVSPPVLKQVKNKALHEKYIDHLHVREAKRKAEYNRLVGKENVRPVVNQTNVRAAKDALFFDVQDAVQKLKGLETENSSSSSEFCYGLGETDDEDESI